MGMVSFIKEKIQARKKVKEVAEVEIEQEEIKQEEIVNESSPRELYMGEFLTVEEIKERHKREKLLESAAGGVVHLLPEQ